jgi:hypothetical protein
MLSIFGEKVIMAKKWVLSSRSKQPYLLIVVLIPWKRIILCPTLLLQVSNDVQTGRLSGLVTPNLPHLVNACKMMAQSAMAHPVRWLARKFIQPEMDFFKGLAERSCSFGAVLGESRH